MSCTVFVDAAGQCHSFSVWMPGHTTPVMDGLYQRLSSDGLIRWSMYEGGIWRWNYLDPHRAVGDRAASLMQFLSWRGLSAPPDGGYALNRV